MDTQNGKTAVPDEVREAMARAISGAPFSTARSRRKAGAALSVLAAAGWACVPVRALQVALSALEEEHGFEPQDVRCGTCRAQTELRALLSASQAKEQAP